jgi:hypothetical protein
MIARQCHRSHICQNCQRYDNIRAVVAESTKKIENTLTGRRVVLLAASPIPNGGVSDSRKRRHRMNGGPVPVSLPAGASMPHGIRHKPSLVRQTL